MSVILLGGSPSPQSSCNRLLQHIGDKLTLHGHPSTRIDVRELPAQALLRADTCEPGVARAVALVREADAIVIATPVYKASYTGVLKLFLDLLPQDGLAGKLVLPVATGGSQSHVLALDYALRPVLSSMAARFILPSIYATSEQVAAGIGCGLRLAPPVAARVAQGVEQLAAELQLLGERAEQEEDLFEAPLAA